MSCPTNPGNRSLPHSEIASICDGFEAELRAGKKPKIEDFLGDMSEPARSALLRDLQAIEEEIWRRKRGVSACPPDTVQVVQREHAELVVSQSTRDMPGQRKDAAAEDTPVHPALIGKYRIEKVLGRGSFGTVYQGFDSVLKRMVAIKVPHAHMVNRPEDVELYLQEGQVVASLDHPHIVPVYEAERTADGLCYVVSKFIEGTNLGARIKRSPLRTREAAEIIAVIAEALHHAHLRKVVHRDIKPANILLDCTGKPYVADFGLALTDEQFGRPGHGAGTPVYMSPEQARGEGHLVDGRSDTFSLGVVFYELLTGTRPFQGKDSREVIERIKKLDVRPPRQLVDSIPKELERVCLKALSKRATERYTTAMDMADDLRYFLSGVPVKRASRSKKLLLAGIGGGGMALLLGIVLAITFHHGTLVVEIDEKLGKDVQVAVSQGGEKVQLVDAKSGWTLSLGAGKYDLAVQGGDDKFNWIQGALGHAGRPGEGQGYAQIGLASYCPL